MAFNTYNEFIDSNRSEKIVLAHVHGVKRLYGLTLDSGLYSKVTPYFVTGVKDGNTNTSLTSVNSTEEVTDATRFYYNHSTSKLYLYAYDSASDEIIITYRLFFSSIPINLSWDLNDYSPE